ncbi:MAG: NfeD family protein [SAR324 cluster bacterium]|nr:NfeD family protein [SAR324 cluster bacterium]
MEIITWIWLIAGAILLISELVIPGAVVAFLGAGALLIGLGQWAGLIDGWMESFMYWFVVSMGLVIVFRGLVMKMFPSESRIEYDDEDLDDFGKIVDVLEEISFQHENGRIRLHGSTWAATIGKGSIPAGAKARLIERDKLVWLVEACSEEELEIHRLEEGEKQ